MDFKIKVVKIKGHCPVYQQDDTFYLRQGYIIDTKRSCHICMHSLASIFLYYIALGHGVEPADLGLSPERGKPARVQCLDPCEYTGGGTVILEIIKE